MSIVRATASVIATAIVAGLFASTAGALTPPPAEKAEIVFENGGRIVSIKADGSERRILTRKNAVPAPEGGPYGPVNPVFDRSPSISPDGRNLLFLRQRQDRKTGDSTYEVMVADRDGGNQRVVWTSGRNGWIDDLAWAPDGEIVFGRTAYPGGKDERTVSAFHSIGLEGGSLRTLFKRETKQSDFKNYENFLSFGYGQFTLSPDGEELLYVNWRRNLDRIVSTDLASRQTRVVVPGGTDPAFSPDGSRIAFIGDFTATGERCAERCRSSLMVADADGGNRRRVVTGISRSSDPAFSPGGGRIVFQSDRNLPGAFGISEEIYSVSPEGDPCLTWLTNGSPASGSPSWGPESDRLTGPGGCGVDRKPLVEIGPPKVKRKKGRPVLWAGPIVKGALLTATESSRNGERYKYEDCGYFKSDRCLKPFVVETGSKCSAHMVQTVDIGKLRARKRVRGALFLQTGRPGKPKGSLLATGTSAVFIGMSMFDLGFGPGKPFGAADHLAVVRSLRPVGSFAPPSGRLPAPDMKRCGRGR